MLSEEADLLIDGSCTWMLDGRVLDVSIDKAESDGSGGISVIAADSLVAISAASLPRTSTWPGIHCSTTLPEE